MSKLRDAAQQALEALETVLSDAYHRRFPECCGRPGIECCGNPNEAWTPEDNKIMDLLSPAQRQLSDALRAALAEQAEQQCEYCEARVMRGLLRQCAEVLCTVEPKSDTEGEELYALLHGIQGVIEPKAKGALL